MAVITEKGYIIGATYANNGQLTITQNGVVKGTFTANQSINTVIALVDTTYENKAAASGGTDLSLVTTGEKYNWNNKSTVTANPQTTTATLTSITIDGVSYEVQGGGGAGTVTSVNNIGPDANGNVSLNMSDIPMDIDFKYIGSTAPTNTKLIWFDSANGYIMKIYDETTSPTLVNLISIATFSRLVTSRALKDS